YTCVRPPRAERHTWGPKGRPPVPGTGGQPLALGGHVRSRRLRRHLSSGVYAPERQGRPRRRAPRRNGCPGMKTIGFVGLGNMGVPMARNLAAAGFSLVLRDLDPARQEQVAAELAAAAADVPAGFAGVEAV